MVNPSCLRHIVKRESLAGKNQSNIEEHIRNLHAPVPPLPALPVPPGSTSHLHAVPPYGGGSFPARRRRHLMMQEVRLIRRSCLLRWSSAALVSIRRR